ncbi:phosphonatase-like hydrolase [Curtobacterium sp. USHLN213]|uniref:phosphonatase-like hydrolase n=1 Tax=Curtobacterium sp. USHLN213 TaxID=3081255 RepID=UPI0030192B2A
MTTTDLHSGRTTMIDLVALDIAGTTLDDGGTVYDALRAAVEERGATVAPDDLQTWMGTDKVTAIDALLRLGGVTPTAHQVAESFDRFRAILRSRYAEQPAVILPGVADAVRTLRAAGVKVALTTGFSRDIVDLLLDSVGWQVDTHLDAVVTTDDVPAGRPAPYMIHRAMEWTGVTDVRRVLAAGDTVVDLRAAENAGVVSVGVLTGQTPREALEAEPHDHVLASVSALPELLLGAELVTR